jgi:hypothetical protein
MSHNCHGSDVVGFEKRATRKISDQKAANIFVARQIADRSLAAYPCLKLSFKCNKI